MRVNSGCFTAAAGGWVGSEAPDGVPGLVPVLVLETGSEGSPVEGDDEVHAAKDSATPSAAPRGNDRFRISSSGCGFLERARTGGFPGLFAPGPAAGRPAGRPASRS